MNRTPIFKFYLTLLFCLSNYCLPSFTYGATVTLNYGEIIEKTICEGDCIVFENGTYCEEGAYPLGNDRTLKINVLPSVQHLDQTICEGETFPGQDWSTSGQYTYQTTMGACEITVMVNLKVAQHKETFVNQQIKYGECYDVGPNTFCQTGEYELRYLTNEGCDSTIYINLVVEELLVDTLPSVSVCAGESYSPNGIDTVLTESGLYQFFDINSEGRSTLTLLDFRVENRIIKQIEAVSYTHLTLPTTPYV